jgi:tetratricopeptide (TPR) repeat protein
MGETKRVPFASAFACAVVLMNLGWLSAPSRAAAGVQSSGLSPEDERRRMEDALKRRGLFAEYQEQKLLDDLNRARERYYSEKETSARAECESLLTQVLAMPKPSARAYSVCAATASMLGRPQQAIDIVKQAIARYPEEHIEGPILPLKISGYYRIGALATRIGDINEATRAYESVIANSQGRKDKEYLTGLCHIYLADLDRRTPGRESMAAERLRQVIQTADSVNRDGRDGSDLFAIDLMRSWAAWELARIERGSAVPETAAVANGDCLIFIATWGIISCPSLAELEQTAASGRPSILRDLAGVTLAVDHLHKSDLSKAQAYLSRVAESDSYFRAQARVSLEAVRATIRQMHERIPGLVHDLKYGALEQQEQAVSRLKSDSGPEGIKAIQDAQEDPDKRVRCLAACALASQFRDRSIKPKVAPILEGLADEEPRIRKMAQSAIASHSGLEFGPGEVGAMVKLLDEHYSEELLSATVRCLLFSEAKAEANVETTAELAHLINHENQEIRGKMLDTLGMMDAPPAQVAGALAQRLDSEHSEDAQIRIIGVLERIGPAAKAAVPVLLKYAQRDDPNIQHLAIEALTRISPADAAQIRKTAGEP